MSDPHSWKRPAHLLDLRAPGTPPSCPAMGQLTRGLPPALHTNWSSANRPLRILP